jgi:hypothetical protein
MAETPQAYSDAADSLNNTSTIVKALQTAGELKFVSTVTSRMRALCHTTKIA